MDVLIEDPRALNSYLVTGAEDVEEAIEAAQEREPKRYTSELSMQMHATVLDDLEGDAEDFVAGRGYALGQPVAIEL